ncbi:MAG: sigma-70 family RNA polymerase sigma factor [Caulobacteraceae bacterium]|nr:sigma-70 family RNA polymerase sigma factor [Caulobacteraceae bacterium]
MGEVPRIRADDLRDRLDARFRGPLMSFFIRRVGNRGDAEDLTQEVFMRLLTADGHDGILDAEAFVFQVAANLLRDRGRKLAIRSAAQLAEVDHHLVSEVTREFLETADPERTVLARESMAHALKALSELGERTRDIYVLFRLEGMKQREIAALYGLTAKAVEKHVMRANLHLALRFGMPL